MPASVCLDGRTGAQPQLQWHPIKRWKENAGETLAAAILFLNVRQCVKQSFTYPYLQKRHTLVYTCACMDMALACFDFTQCDACSLGRRN